jgi:undecaprenyl diphosphate synthase
MLDFNNLFDYIKIAYIVIICIYLFNTGAKTYSLSWILLFLGVSLILYQVYHIKFKLPFEETKLREAKSEIESDIESDIESQIVSATPLKKNLHLGFIMDGNGRWAKAKGLSRIEGHTRGEEVVTDILIACSKHEYIKYATFYALSLQNWKRSKLEIDHILKTVLNFFKKMRNYYIENNIKFQCIGNKQHLPKELVETVNDLERDTSMATGLVCSICLSYGGREDILDTFRNIKGDLSTMTTSDISNISPIPDLDLVIRTSGEYRISNFCLWQSAYTEYYFTNTMWPDFTVKELHTAIDEFQMRNRTMGEVKTDHEEIPSVEEKYTYLKTLFSSYTTVIDPRPLYNKLLEEGYTIDPSIEGGPTKDRGLKEYVTCSIETFDLINIIDDCLDALPMDLQIKNLKRMYTDFSLENIEHLTQQPSSELYYKISSKERALLKKMYECEHLIRVSKSLNDKTIYRLLNTYYYMNIVFNEIVSDNHLLLLSSTICVDDFLDEDDSPEELKYITEDTNRIISNIINEIWNTKGLPISRERVCFALSSSLINHFYMPVPTFTSFNAFAKYIFRD